VLLEQPDVGLHHLVEVGSGHVEVTPDDAEEPVWRAEEGHPEAELLVDVEGAEEAGGHADEVADLRDGEAVAAEAVHADPQGVVDAAAEDARVFGHEQRDLGLGEAERRAGEEGQHGVGVGGRFPVRDALGGVRGLLPGEAAGGDEVVIGGEVAPRGAGRGGGGEGRALEGELYEGGGAMDGKEMFLQTNGEVFLEAEHGGGGGGSARLRPLLMRPPHRTKL